MRTITINIDEYTPYDVAHVLRQAKALNSVADRVISNLIETKRFDDLVTICQLRSEKWGEEPTDTFIPWRFELSTRDVQFENDGYYDENQNYLRIYVDVAAKEHYSPTDITSVTLEMRTEEFNAIATETARGDA